MFIDGVCVLLGVRLLEERAFCVVPFVLLEEGLFYMKVEVPKLNLFRAGDRTYYGSGR